MPITTLMDLVTLQITMEAQKYRFYQKPKTQPANDLLYKK